MGQSRVWRDGRLPDRLELVVAVIVTGAIIFVVPTDIGYMIGPSGAWLTHSPLAAMAITGFVMAGITLVAVRGLEIGKWLHNIGSSMILLPKLDIFTIAVFGQMTVGALSGFEYVAILAGECRSAARTIGQSVIVSAPIIALMFILGTSSVLTFVGNQPINLIGPIPQTFRVAFGAASWAAPFAILLVIARAVAGASLIFTGLTRLPMTAGWDNLVPGWFTRLHPVHRTPVNSILFVAVLVMALILLSMLGVREQEANQLLAISAVVHYAIAYIALFAIPIFGRLEIPSWLKPIAAIGLLSSIVSLFFAVYPIVDVVSKAAYGTRFCRRRGTRFIERSALNPSTLPCGNRKEHAPSTC